MSDSLLSRYIWMVDTVKRRGRITRAELQRRWADSGFSDGNPMCRRTLYNYRNAIRDLFSINIECDPVTYEYYIAEQDTHNSDVTDWLLNTQAVNDALAGARDVSDRIFLENVPSAREHLGTVIEALRQNRRLRFDYRNYSRSRPTRGVVFEPYFLKIFKQRWYMVGRHVADNRIKTYALDRMQSVTHEPDTFNVPETFDAESYFHYSFGIVVTQNAPKRVAIRTDHRNANYLRGLPLHHSQQEVVHDGFSIFYYNMRITDDLVNELLSHGPRIQVLEPPELRMMIAENLRNALRAYEPKNNDKNKNP